MFNTVIVPLDGSEHAESAIPYAVDEARRHDAAMVLIHVIPQPEPCIRTIRRSGPLPEICPTIDVEREECAARHYLQSVVTRFGMDAATKLCVVAGDPSVRIAAEAKRYANPLVVLTTGGPIAGKANWYQRSHVAESLLTEGSLPILGIHPTSPGEQGSALPLEMQQINTLMHEQDAGAAGSR